MGEREARLGVERNAQPSIRGTELEARWCGNPRGTLQDVSDYRGVRGKQNKTCAPFLLASFPHVP